MDSLNFECRKIVKELSSELVIEEDLDWKSLSTLKRVSLTQVSVKTSPKI